MWKLLDSCLSTLEIPVRPLDHEGTDSTYLTFQLIASVPEGHADDDYTATLHTFRVNIFSNSNYTSLLKKTLNVLREAGFDISSVDGEIYEEDTELYHIPITITILEEE